MMDVETLIATRDEVRPLSVGVVPAGDLSSPIFLQNERDAFVVFDALVEGSDTRCGCAMIRLQSCLVTRFGYPNDRELLALMGPQLYPRGPGIYGVFEVHNSSWIAEIQEQQQRCLPYLAIPSRRHILITFQGSTFEAIAQAVSAVTLEETRSSAVSTLTQVLLRG